MSSRPPASGGQRIAGNFPHRTVQPSARPGGGAPPRNSGDLSGYGYAGYGDTEASRRAFEYRMELIQFRREMGLTGGGAPFSSANVAVITYTDRAGKPQMMPMISSGGMVGGQPGGPHSEDRLLQAIRAAGIDPKSVTAIYTERAPCSTPREFDNRTIEPCSVQLARELPNVPVTCSVPWPENEAQQGQWTGELRRQFRGLVGDARYQEMIGEGGEAAARQRTPEQETIASQLRADVERRLGDNPTAIAILAGRQEGRTFKEIQASLGASDAEFGAARQAIADAT
jgi:hypothetical protein